MSLSRLNRGALARYDDAGWTTFTDADGVEPWHDTSGYWGYMVPPTVAADGSLWLEDFDDYRCGGAARYDGTTWTSYLEEHCINDLAIAPDGGVWLGASAYDYDTDIVGPAGLYVITPEAVAAKEQAWDLVWFSDSVGFDVADLWAARIEEELGVEVRVHDHAVGGLSAMEVLVSLDPSIDGFPRARARLGDTRSEVAEAEIVVVFGNPTDSGSTVDFVSCVSTSTVPRDPPTRYSGEDLEPYRDVLVSIYERVFELVGDRPVIVRTIDWPNPFITDWPLAGVDEECTAAWEAWSDSIADAAAGFDVPLVSMYDAFNGPDHTEDPRAKGYAGPDGWHPSAAGSEAMVAALHEAGYEPLRP